MRSDYSLYIIGLIFFLITAASYTMINGAGERTTWMVATAILGILFVSLGFTFRPRPPSTQIRTQTQPPAPAPASAMAIQTVEESPKPIAPIETKPQESTPTITQELARVRGLGAKRAEELKTIGISSIQELAIASPLDIATRLNVSPRIAKLWIGQAKKLLQNS